MTASPRPAALARRAGIGAALALLVLTGCGYRLAGAGALPDHVHRIAVPLFENRSGEPEISQRLTENVVDEFIARGGYVAVSSPAEADAVLRGVVLSYRTIPVSVDPDGLARRYEIQIRLQAELRDRVQDVTLWKDDHFVFRGQYDVDEEQVRSFDRSIVAIEEVSREAARSVVATILEGF